MKYVTQPDVMPKPILLKKPTKQERIGPSLTIQATPFPLKSLVKELKKLAMI